MNERTTDRLRWLRQIAAHPAVAPIVAAILALLYNYLLLPLAEQYTIHVWKIDPDKWWYFGTSLANGNGLRLGPQFQLSVYRGPIFPAVLAVLNWITGNSRELMPLFNAGVLAFCVWMLARIVRPGFGERIARRSAWLLALYPLAAWYCTRILQDIFFLALFLVCVEFSRQWLKRPTWPATLRWGLAMGILTLTKSVPLLLPLFLAPVYLLHWRRAAPEGLRHPMAIGVRFVAGCLIMLTTVAPWTLRNYTLTGAVIPVHTTGGENFFKGNYITAHFFDRLWPPPGYMMHYHAAHLEVVERAEMRTQYGWPAEVEQEQRLSAQIPGWIVENPGKMAHKLLVGTFMFFFAGSNGWFTLLALLIHGPLILLAVRGLRRGPPRPETMLFLTIIAYWTLIHAAIFAFIRGSLPAMSLLIPLAALGLGGAAPRTPEIDDPT